MGWNMECFLKASCPSLRSNNDPGRKKAFALIEGMVAGLVLSLIGAGMVGIYLVQTMNSSKVSHRMDAANYAMSIAETLMAIDVTESTPPGKPANLEFSAGTHNAATDPSICALPDSYFTKALGGKASYFIDDLQANDNVKVTRARIKIEWDEKPPKAAHVSESLCIAVYMHVNNPPP